MVTYPFYSHKPSQELFFKFRYGIQLVEVILKSLVRVLNNLLSPSSSGEYLTHLHFARSGFLFFLLSSNCNCCKILDDTFRVHSLPCTRFSTVKSKWNKQSEPKAVVTTTLVNTQQKQRLKTTYVIRIDWFSRSVEKKQKISLNTHTTYTHRAHRPTQNL